jgi:hypothetical protein
MRSPQLEPTTTRTLTCLCTCDSSTASAPSTKRGASSSIDASNAERSFKIRSTHAEAFRVISAGQATCAGTFELPKYSAHDQFNRLLRASIPWPSAFPTPVCPRCQSPLRA